MNHLHRRLLFVSLCLLVNIGPQGEAQSRHDHRRHSTSHGDVISAAAARQASVRKVELSHHLHSIHSHIREVRARIGQARAQEVKLDVSISSIQKRLVAARERLDVVNRSLQRLGREHDLLVYRLQGTKLRLGHRRRVLAARIRETYLRGQISYAQALIQASSIQDLLARGVYVRQIVRSDAILIRGVRQDIQQVEDDKKLLEAQSRKQQGLAAEFESEKAVYVSDLSKERELLKTARAAQQRAQADLDESEGEAEEMTGRIQSLSEMLTRRQEAETEARRARVRQYSGGGNQAAESVTPIWNGRFIRPCPGPINSGFGSRYHPILHRRRMHTGVDIGAPYGTSIRAAGAGIVILASYVSGYGNCVVLDHGSGITTLYGHCSALLVSEGDSVLVGQVIARVGATGLATGPHLHFEVRHNGVPVPPF